MSENTQKLTLKDLYTFLVCITIVMTTLILPRIGASSISMFFPHLIQFNFVGYPYSNPPIFFSIGEALSAIAILFAVYQFKKEKWSLALRIRSYIEPVVFSCVIISVLISIYSSIVTFHLPSNVFQLSVFWQIISSIFVCFSITFLFLRASNKNLFNKRTARKFYEILSWEIARPNEERLNLTLNVLLDNLENICKSVSQEDLNTEINKSARNILDVILSDGSMVKLLTTKRLDGLIYILSVFKKYDINRYHSQKGLPMLIQGLFLDNESYFYKQLDHNGLALSANIYKVIFDSPELLSNFDFFGYPTLGYGAKPELNTDSISVLTEAISKSINTYLKTGNVPAIHISHGIKILSNLIGQVCSEIKDEQEAGIKTKRYGKNSNWWLLHKLTTFFGHDYIFIGNQEVMNKDVVDREKKAQNVNFDSNLAINEAIAGALYKAFEHLYKIEKGDDTYSIVWDLLNGITSEPSYKEGYAVPFEKRMWEQIGANVLGKHYPVVLKSYLNAVGFALVGDAGQRTGWIGEQAEKMRRLLYIDLKPLLDKKEKMIDGTPMKEALLPDCMDYRDGEFTYTMGFGRDPTEEIAPPPNGSNSALQDVAWENPHHADDF